LAGRKGYTREDARKKKVFQPRIFCHAPLEQADLPETQVLPRPGLRERAALRVRKWISRRLQKRLEREWREYDHTPKVSFGPLLRRCSKRAGTPVYRSLVQIHFHPRAREQRE
jgi:hypothetical protein